MNTQDKTQKAHSALLMYGMFSIIMLFAGLTSAYLVHKKSLISHPLGVCNLSNSILRVDGPVGKVGPGFFIYTTDDFFNNRLLLGVWDSIQNLDFNQLELENKKKSNQKQIIDIESNKQSSYSIALTNMEDPSLEFDSQNCFGSKWDYIELPKMFYFSTIIILLSSVLGWFIIKCCKRNNFKLVRLLLLVTLFFGLLFAVFQFFGWNYLIQNFRYVGGDSNVASSYLYLLTGAHFAHLIAGVIALAVIYFKSLYNKYDIDNFHGIKLGIQFWHFLTVLWVFLFFYLLLVNL